jgi:hypothetical protein
MSQSTAGTAATLLRHIEAVGPVVAGALECFPRPAEDHCDRLAAVH